MVFWSTESLFSQTYFEEMPANATEIHFVYEVKSNYLVTEEGIFADTLLFKIDFPKLKFDLRKHPNDSNRICGYTLLKGFGYENKAKLKGILYHTNETINATHFILSKKTVFNVIRGDDEIKKIYKHYFKERFVDFEYKREFDFNKRTEIIKFPTVRYDFTFYERSQKLEYKSEDDFGFYYEIKNNMQFKNLVLFEKTLSKYISPILFVNNNFGIKELETVRETIKLRSVQYK